MGRPKGSKNKPRDDFQESPFSSNEEAIQPVLNSAEEKSYVSKRLPPPAFKDRAALLKELATDHREARDSARQEEGEEVFSTVFEKSSDESSEEPTVDDAV